MASSNGDDEPSRPTTSALETRPTAAPAIHNLELVVGIKPLRSEAGP